MAAEKAPVGDPIRSRDGRLEVPDRPVIPFIEGDGTGPDIWRASQRVFDAAVEKAYGGKRKVAWYEVLAGEKAFNRLKTWLPDETVEAFRTYLVGIKGPLTTPIGGGIRSLNVALRQMLDLYVCLRPVRYFKGVPSPVRRPELVDVVIFRENTEDIYAGIEWAADSAEAKKIIAFLQKDMGVKNIRFPEQQRHRHQARVARGHRAPGAGGHRVRVARRPQERDPGAQGQHHEVHRGRLPRLGLCAGPARVPRADRHRARELDPRQQGANAGRLGRGQRPAVEPGYDLMTAEQQAKVRAEVETALKLWPTHGDGKWKKKLLMRDAIADITLQQVLTRADEFDVVATLNLNGDYLSDALAAQVGGIGIAPGGNINYDTGHAIFEATHGTAPKYANLDKVNPGSVILSGDMMFRHLGWTEAADLIIKGMEGAIAAKTVTYDFHRQMEGATLLKCSEFGEAIVAKM